MAIAPKIRVDVDWQPAPDGAGTLTITMAGRQVGQWQGITKTKADEIVDRLKVAAIQAAASTRQLTGKPIGITIDNQG